ncbi:lipopolysaccharide assembly protein LapB [Halomonas sp. WWR20]
MLDPLLLALLVAAIAIGWWLGRVEHGSQRKRSRDDRALSRDYFVGLNHLLNEQPDRAIETFVQALEVNSDTIETHIALGNLFRSRGEADRAVKIHQNLLARPTLTSQQSGLVQLELSRDFLNLGLLDRAERLLHAMIKETSDNDLSLAAKRLLIDLLEREREWQDALNIAQPQLVRQDPDIRRAAAHWLCEMAQQDRHSASPALARKHLQQALNIDAQCVRANCLLAELEEENGHYKAMIRILQRVPGQDRDFLPVILDPIRQAFLMLEDEKGLQTFLEQQIQEAPFTSVIIMLAETLYHHEGPEAATLFVSDQLQRQPSLRGLDYLMDLYLTETDAKERKRILLLKQHTHKLLETRPRYRCHRCGLGVAQLHWQCPSCRKWGTSKPITGLEGE